MLVQKFITSAAAKAPATFFARSRMFSALTPAFSKLAAPSQESSVKLHPSLLNPAGARHGGTGVLGAGLAMAAVGGCGQGVGTVFAAFIVGLARNPAMKDEMFTYTLMGFAMVEFFFFAIIGMAVVLYASE
jgi:F-type H+-transporting ATPase subunit c